MWRYDDLSIVTEVVKQGSFIKASETLNIPSSTVSRRVSEFEKAIGIRLIERNARKFSLTEQGAYLFERAHPQLQTIKNTIQEIQTIHDQPTGKLKVTAPVTLGNELLSEWFCDFATAHPTIALDIVLDNQNKDLIEEQFDLAFRVGPLDDSNFIAQFLFASDFILCASPEHLKRGTLQTSDIQSLVGKPYLAYQSGEKSLKLEHVATSRVTELSIQTSFSSTNTAVLRQAATKGLGVACLPKVSVSNELLKGELVHIYSDYVLSPRPQIYAVYPSKYHMAYKTRLFLEFIKEKSLQVEHQLR